MDRISEAVSEVLIVTRPEILDSLPPRDEPIVTFDQVERGMGATLAFAITQVAHWQAAMICLAYMPFICSTSYKRIADTVTEHTIVVPRFGSQTGNPVAFGRDFFL